ncbi:MAG: hypothetical protein A3K09_05320 [Nitrospinae bacterium RIFCSPLOWO2_12_FULL_47_7]|nr:MAG: hypothetical protein A3K09_05320 [Nitrospinae bacterium RIFCSPLOWO2_12_FULL_47_7]
MDTDQKISLLKHTDLMSFFDVGALRQLAENCREIRLRKNETLFEEGSLEIAMYIVLSGEVSISKGNKQIAILGPGQYLGEMSLIESKSRSASAKAVSEAVLMEVSEDQFNRYLATEPKALIAIMKTLSSRIRHDLEVMAADLRKLSIFAHDIKNYLSPLSLAELYLEELLVKSKGTLSHHTKREGFEDLEKICEVISDAKAGLDTLTNNSLSYSKKIKVDYIKNKTLISPLIKKTIEGISCHKYLKGKAIKLNLEDGTWEGKINALDIERVLQNLIINAGHASTEEGLIEVTVKTNGKDLLFSISDKGYGIPEEVKPYLFKDSVTTKADGNGFGLLSCKEIIEERHQGRLWYDSTVGQGTAFHFTLPIESSW